MDASTQRVPRKAAGKPTPGPRAVQAKLWRAYRKRPGPLLRNSLVETYQPLVRDVVRRFALRLPRSVDHGDLETAGNFGLIAAIESFDPERGVRFESYGELRIKGALLDELRSQDWLPRPMRSRVEHHKRTLERLRGEQSREPLEEEVAREMGMDLWRYRQTFGALPSGPAEGSPRGEDGDGPSNLDVVPDTHSDAPGEKLSRDELLRLVTQKLTEQEYRIVYLRYWEELSMREIGELEGISESRVCKIHGRLLERLADRLRSSAG